MAVLGLLPPLNLSNYLNHSHENSVIPMLNHGLCSQHEHAWVKLQHNYYSFTPWPCARICGQSWWP
jgi:hypothetical protein